ncbi:filamentous hemagglutinin N-terminal domain-containing protein [Nitrospira sp. MA-1]|nr:filamentous hemagglutinin N-terminal domain-containing protein [Nitrospira sp. MA-1]
MLRFPFKIFHRQLRRILVAFLSVGTFVIVDGSPAQAQTPPITSSGLNTQVSAPRHLPGGAVQHDITGGTRPGGGSNLFHSFGDFGVPTDNIANFLNDSGLPTSNILSRVTGGNPSNIFGTIQTKGFGNANLFLMNPAGIVFGPNAALNVGGATHFTTADYVRLEDGAQFTALPGAQDSLLSIAPIVAFGFLGPNPAGISVEGSTLSISEGQPLSLIGGDITIGRSNLTAPGGQIALASVGSPGEILANTFDQTSNIHGHTMGSGGTIRISDQSVIDAGGEHGGKMLIRGGRLVLDHESQIRANTLGAQDGGHVDIAVSENVLIAGTGAQTDTPSGIFAKTEGGGKGGTITISASSVKLTDGGNLSVSTRGEGDAGTIMVNAPDGKVILSGSDNRLTDFSPEEEAVSGLFANTVGTGRAGTITVQTGDLTISEGARISAGTFGRGNGDAGKLFIAATGDVLLSGTQVNGSTSSGLFAGASELTLPGNGLLGSGGTINMTGQTVRILDGAKIHVASIGQEQPDMNRLDNAPSAGTVNIKAAMLDLTGAELDGKVIDIIPSEITASATGPASAGHILLEADNITIKDGGGVTADTESITRIEKTGDIQIQAKENLVISGTADRTEFPPNLLPQNTLNPRTVVQSAVRAQTKGVNRGGEIHISAENLFVDGGGLISNAALNGAGAGGNIHLDVVDTIRLSGAYEKVDKNRTIFRSEISSGTEGPGHGGDISITAKNVEMLDGAWISSRTRGRGSGHAGRVSITAEETVSLSGFMSVYDPEINNTSKTQEISSRIIARAEEHDNRLADLPLGNAGDISITAKNVVMKDGAEIIAPSSSGRVIPITDAIEEIVANMPEEQRPRAGNITVKADTIILSGARTVGGSGKFGWAPTTIRAGVIGPAGTGNVSLTANTIVIRDGADISAETQSSTQGVQRGNVTITAHDSLTLSGYLLRTEFPENPIGSDPFPEANGRTIRPTSIVARTSGTNQAGDIILSAKNLIITEGAQIANGTLNHQLDNAGGGGKILLTADHLTISGMAPFPDAIGRPLPSIISSRTDGPGQAGQIDITSKTIEIKSGGQISASSIPREDAIGAGAGGNIQIVATERFLAKGVGILEGTRGVRSGIFSSTEGTGLGGNLRITAPVIKMKNGAAISASTTGTGNAGDIFITASDSILLDKASVTTEAGSAVGGNIKLTADNRIDVINSQVTSRVREGSGSAGSINFDPDFIVLKNSQILSTAVAGSGGDITLTANSAIVMDPFTFLDARSRFGGNGRVNIESPVQFLSSTIVPLPQNLFPVTTLYGTKCVAEQGRFSSFVESKADSIAPTPGALLASPLLPFSSHSVASNPIDIHGDSNNQTQADPTHATTYSPPVLFSQTTGQRATCRP